MSENIALVLAKATARYGIQVFVKQVVPTFGLWSRMRRARQLALRNALKPEHEYQVLRSDELALVRCLANLIVPYDDESPGAEDADVVRTIDTNLLGSPDRTMLYAAGLIAINEMARQVSGADFVQMKADQQCSLLDRVQSAADTIDITPALGAKIKSVVKSIGCQWNGSIDAVTFFSVLIADVKQAFYTSEICWRWLEYDGPPMPNGYLTSSQGRLVVTQRRRG